ncbi:MAG: chemotaxis protein [Halomonadaceae bacterium]|nr:MAG: chemotaxis protein [Halomonadaceae bacterium]
MVQSSLATKSHAFDLVRDEIEATIRQAEKSLERFQENRDSGEDLQNSVDCLNQLRGIFTLVELRGGTLLCQEAVALANDVPVGATNDKNGLLTALSNALFTMLRYMEFYQRQQKDHPELLLPIINEVRMARGDRPLPDSNFFQANTRLIPDISGQLQLRPLPVASPAEFLVHSKRFRLMYQVGLLGLLRDRQPQVSRRLMSRAAEGFARLGQETPAGRFWCMAAQALHTMQEQDLVAEKSRKRLFMSLETHARTMVQQGPEACKMDISEAQLLELLYILYRSGSRSQTVLDVLNDCGLAPAECPEGTLLAYRQQLYGPGADVLKALSKALLEELEQLKDKLDIVERGIDPDIEELGLISECLSRLANTLLILDLRQLSDTARQAANKMSDWQNQGIYPAENDLYAIADAVLNIEDAAQHLATHGISAATDALAQRVRHDEQSLYLREALIVVTDEARAALTLAKRAITAFLESDFDKLHLANVPSTLLSIWGGMVLLEDEGAARVMRQVSEAINNKLLDSRSNPEQHVLEALADALTSLEYYIEGLGLQNDRNPELLKLAESSLKDAGL